MRTAHPPPQRLSTALPSNVAGNKGVYSDPLFDSGLVRPKFRCQSFVVFYSLLD